MTIDFKVSNSGIYVPPTPNQVLFTQPQVSVQSVSANSASQNNLSLNFPSPLLVMQQNNQWELSDGTYVGQTQNGIPHGRGVMTYRLTNPNKYLTYEGDFDKGLMHGTGVMIWSNGNRYTGTFTDGKVTGKGTKEYQSNGARYEGDVVDGLAEGQGTYTARDGTKWSGGYLKGKCHGYGEHSFKVHDIKYIYKGNFENDTYNGQGDLLKIHPTGEEYLTTGTFREGQIWEGRGYFTKTTALCAQLYAGSATYKNGVDQSNNCCVIL